MVPWEKGYLEGSEGVSKETYIARKMSENSDKHAFKFTSNFLEHLPQNPKNNPEAPFFSNYPKQLDFDSWQDKLMWASSDV